jgi:predicted  nucleic acid-binding Zn-ribbon protein
MYLEERIKSIEERISALEVGGGSNHHDEIRERLLGLEEKGTRLSKRTQSIESRLEELGRGDSSAALAERIDQCETTCHDLLSTDDSLRDRCESTDRRLSALTKQLDSLLEQVAELDGKHSRTDNSGLESRLRHLEGEMHDLRSLRELRGIRTEVQERLVEFERAIAKSRSRIDEMDDALEGLRGRSTSSSFDISPFQSRLGAIETSFDSVRQMGTKLDSLTQEMRRRLEDLTGRIDRSDMSTRELDQRLAMLDRELLPGRVRTMEERLSGQDPAQRTNGLGTRVDLIEREAGDLKREVTWLRDRPTGVRFDQWARVLGSGALAASVLALALWVWPKSVVTAERFVLVDRNEREIGELASNEHGACLELQDRAGQRRLFLAATGTGSMLSMSDDTGASRTQVTAEPRGGTGLLVLDPAGQRRMWLGVQENQPALYMLDPEGDVRGSMSIESTGPEIGLFEKNSEPSVRLLTGQVDNGLRVYDQTGRLRVGVGMAVNGATVNLFDPAEKRRVVLSSSMGSAALAFLGKDEIQRTTLGMTEKDESILNLHDNDGRQRVLLIASEQDAKLEVLDRDTNVIGTVGRQ